MSWSAVVAALDEGERLRSRVALYLHPLAGRPIIWHVVRAVLDAVPAPADVRVLHRPGVALRFGEDAERVTFEAVEQGRELAALRGAVDGAETKVVVDGAAPLLTAATVSRLARAGESAVSAMPDESEAPPWIAVAGDGRALAAADDPRARPGAAHVTPAGPEELLRVVDRLTLAGAAVAMRDRLVRAHGERGVTFMLPATTWVDVDVRIGGDTLIYPGVVLEGETEIGRECVIGPHSRIVESRVGRGAELVGWNYLARTEIRSHAVLEAYERRGQD
ncbi:MAG TPA: hypothetical protein VKA84_19675 [Gemmatimonadaceae bacterium]|nr:hypothetical protein [Gemmatimonadaceae bacterium]